MWACFHVSFLKKSIVVISLFLDFFLQNLTFWWFIKCIIFIWDRQVLASHHELFWRLLCESVSIGSESVSRSVVSILCNPINWAYQAPLSMELSRQEYWSGYAFPSPGDLSDPWIEPGSSVLQADSLPSEPPGKLVNIWEIYFGQKAKHSLEIFFNGCLKLVYSEVLSIWCLTL